MAIEKMTEVPYPGLVPWMAIRKKMNELVDGIEAVEDVIEDLPAPPTTVKMTRSVISDVSFAGLRNILNSPVQRIEAVDGIFTVSGESISEAGAVLGFYKTGSIMNIVCYNTTDKFFTLGMDMSSQNPVLTFNGGVVSMMYLDVTCITYTIE